MASAATELSELQRVILETERRWWKHPGAKVARIRESLGLSEARYYQLLHAMLDLPAAEAYDAQLVNRLRRLRDARRQVRRP